MEPSPKSLIIDLLSSVRGESMPVSALVGAGELFAIEENSVRVALARLVSKGLVARSRPGGYALGPSAVQVQRQVGAWRTVSELTVAWEGAWVAVHTGSLGKSDRKSLRKRSRALRLLGFKELAPGLEVRPDNLRAGVIGLRASLYELGLESTALVGVLDGLDPETEARARALWDTNSIRSRYREITSRLHRSLDAIGTLPLTEAMRETFVLGGTAIRELVLDPLLPDELVPGSERDALVEAAADYDREGKQLWAAFMSRYGVANRNTPADTGRLYGANRISIIETGATS